MDILTGRRVGHTPFPRVRAISIAAPKIAKKEMVDS